MATAVLCCDYQPDVLGFLDTKVKTDVVTKAKQVLEAARNKNLLVVFIRAAFKPGYPEVSPNNQAFAGFRSFNVAIDGTPGAAIIEELKPRDNEFVLAKTRFGSFSTTPLRTILGAQGVNHIVLFGVSTSGVILTTVREAADMDFKITVVSDACADRSAEAHKVLTEVIFPVQAKVVTADQWIHSIDRSE